MIEEPLNISIGYLVFHIKNEMTMMKTMFFQVLEMDIKKNFYFIPYILVCPVLLPQSK